jgi:PAS domain S-box-containing protein
MHVSAQAPNGREISFGADEIIVSKTDLKGHITYANDVFCRVSGYHATDLLGQPHNVIRHPGMPRAVFKLLWDTVQAGEEIFAYVVNLASNGDSYWVFAHVTPSFDASRKMVGYHSNRRLPYADAMPKVRALYAQLLAEESRHARPREAAAAGLALLQSTVRQAGVNYPEFVFALSAHTCLDCAKP